MNQLLYKKINSYASILKQRISLFRFILFFSLFNNNITCLAHFTHTELMTNYVGWFNIGESNVRELTGTKCVVLFIFLIGSHALYVNSSLDLHTGRCLRPMVCAWLKTWNFEQLQWPMDLRFFFSRSLYNTRVLLQTQLFFLLLETKLYFCSCVATLFLWCSITQWQQYCVQWIKFSCYMWCLTYVVVFHSI